MVAGYGLIPELPCHIWHGNLMKFNQCVDTLFHYFKVKSNLPAANT